MFFPFQSEKPRKPRKAKKDKDENKPKRPPTAFMLYLNSMREQIKKDNPGISVTEIAKKGGELWKQLSDKSEWNDKASKAKEEYNTAMKDYTESGGGKDKEVTKKTAKDTKKKEKPSKKETVSKESPVKSAGFKSKEYISDSDSSSNDESDKKVTFCSNLN